MGWAPPLRGQPPISSERIGCSGVAEGGSSSSSARSSEPQPMTTGLVHPRPQAVAPSPGTVAYRRVGPAGGGRSRMRQVASPSSSPSDASRLVPLRRGPARGPPFPPVSLRLPDGRAVQPCPQGLRLPPGSRARTPMEEPLALHPVKLYVYDLSKGMARRLSPLMLGKSTAGALGPPRPPPSGDSRSASDRRGSALPRRETGPKSSPSAPRVAISARYRSAEGAARRGRLPEGARGGGVVRRAQRGL